MGTVSPQPELQASSTFADPNNLPPPHSPRLPQPSAPTSAQTLSLIDINQAATWLTSEEHGQNHERGDSPMPDAHPLPTTPAVNSDLARSGIIHISPDGTIMDPAGTPPPQGSEQWSPEVPDQSMLDAPLQAPPSDFLPPAPTPLPPLPASNDGWDHNPWIPLHEDVSVAGIDELKRLETAGEINALDHQHWERKAFKDLNDPEYVPLASGRIEWTVSVYNGTRESPNKDLVMRSEPVKIGNHSWRIKLYPKGNGTSYLGAYVECDDFVAKDADPQPDCTEQADQPVLKTPLPLLDESKITRPEQVHAQIMIVMYNPQEPRVHFHKKSAHSFMKGDPDRGFSRFGPSPYYDLGRRLPETRQAILRNDTLAFVAHIRVIDDPTGFLFTRDDHDYRRDFARTGIRALAGIPDANGYAANLSSAIVSWALLSPIRNILYAASQHGLEDKPLVAALVEFLCDLRRKPSEDEQEFHSLSPASMDKIATALQWHGGCDAEKQKVFWHPMGRGMHTLDVFRIWEIMASCLEGELQNTEYAGRVSSLFEPRGFRCKMPSNLANVQYGLFHQLVKNDERRFPPLMQVELPRQRFDEAQRKWLKSNDKIPISDTLRLTKDSCGWYTLIGLVVHSGCLTSRSYMPILRADGKHWYKFATDRSQRVVRLTKKQAISDHETSAYAAIYVRDDVAADQVAVDSPTFKGHPETGWTVPEHILNKRQVRSQDCQIEESERSSTPPPPRSPSSAVHASENNVLVADSSAHQTEPKGPEEASNLTLDRAAPVVMSQRADNSDVDMDMDGPTSNEVHELQYFASAYYKGNLHKGFKHGKGRQIYLNGDVYEGDFKKDLRHGYGRQVCSNGDVYDGQWENDKMHGNGKLTSASTGNIYQGGFREGREHGEFILTGKKAETMKSCLICYEQERDAVFYPCGHMCACMGCARELEDCPYCHKQIGEPIRLYVT